MEEEILVELADSSYRDSYTVHIFATAEDYKWVLSDGTIFVSEGVADNRETVLNHAKRIAVDHFLRYNLGVNITAKVIA
jgi:hypothetical protein